MPSDFNKLIYWLPKLSPKRYGILMKTLNNLFSFDLNDVVKFRYHVLCHYYKHGLRSTLDAFNLKKSTFYDWKRTFEQSGKKLSSLIPKSTRPHKTRTMVVDYRLVEFIKSMRLTYGNISKYKIKPFLDAYAHELGIRTIGLTTIGKIIKVKHLTFEPYGTNKKRLTRIRRRALSFKRQRIKQAPNTKQKPGYIQVDSVIVYINKQRHNFISLIDIPSRYGLVFKVKRLTAQQAKLALQIFMNKFKEETGFSIYTVQTDNGSEFLSSFHQFLVDQKIKHIFIYPRLCKVNGIVERFNRTIQEELILRNDEIYYDESAFLIKLDEYLNWYNNHRPHQALNYMAPMQFIKLLNHQSPKSR